MDKSGWNMYVFRDGRRSVPGRSLVDAVTQAIEELHQNPHPEAGMSCLLAAAELECALADAGSESGSTVAGLTDSIAADVVGGPSFRQDEALRVLRGLVPPEKVSVSVHEGFAYYALHPLKFAHIVDSIELSPIAGVVGIRSIGVALSAVMLAALRRRGIDAQRITVRPTGHPYDRHLEFTAEQQAWIQSRSGAQFFVIDEGPGLSGSSFLATGEALERAGARRGDIVLIGTRVPEPYGLRAPDGAQRWTRFRSLSVDSSPYVPEGADIALHGGRWRDVMLNPSAERPGLWTQLESLKFVSADRKRFFKFEGYGKYGQNAAERAQALAVADFSPEFLGNFSGFGCYEFVAGRHLEVRDLNDELLERVAKYCNFRARHFACETPGSELESMVRFNWLNEFGAELESDIRMQIVRPTVTDSRMGFHEWRLRADGRVVKVDASTDGDGHFFPGPCDIAWDLAGTIVEWELSEGQADCLLNAYEHTSGDAAQERIPYYLIAYPTMRMAYARMAARTMGGTPEEPLFMREYERYRRHALEAHMRVVESMHTDLVTGIPGPISPEDTLAA